MAVPSADRTGHIPFEQGHTWYRVTEPVGAPRGLPAVILHGGPGLAHHGCLAMANLSAGGRAVIHYDQIGCGRSSHFPNAASSWWTVDLFVRELRGVVNALQLDRFHLIGHSWGGMLAAEYALQFPDQLASMTICNSPASMALWMDAAAELLSQLPDDVQRTVRVHEEAGTTDSDEYQQAMKYIYERHFCRVVPPPQDLQDTLAQAAEDPTVYHTMNGPSEFTVTGTLRDWSIVDRLPEIRIPTLVLAGEFDEATPETWRPFVDLIPGAQAHVFAEASHTPHLESPTEWLRVVGEFLQAHDES